jgi:putative ABC transport system ATP-binding protein
MKWILRVAGVSKSYPDGDAKRDVLSNLSFQVGPGEVVALTGPSGSGKSTLLNLLAGTQLPDCGHLTLNIPSATEPITVDELSEAARTRLRRRHIGYVFQFFNLIPTLTVRENVLLPLELNGLLDHSSEALERLATLGLADRLDEFPDHLSGGERQRTAIARALAHQPVLVLADEPTGNLDSENARHVIDLLITQVRALGSAMVLATHNESVAARADQVFRLST